jgi:hypothetical protein
MKLLLPMHILKAKVSFLLTIALKNRFHK